jgi:hypothetical protein
LQRAISGDAARKLGERIRAATNADHDTGNPVGEIPPDTMRAI